MFDSDQVTESPELRALREAVDGLEVPPRPPIDAIRGRARLPHGMPGPIGLAATGAVAGAALTLGFAGATGHDGGSRPLGTTAAPQVLRTPAYTLISDASGKVKLTMHPERLFQPGALQSDLARFGVPAKVTAGRYCMSRPAPDGFSRVVSFTTARNPTITINPKAIRHGTELSFGRSRLGAIQAALVTLIRTGRLTCTTSLYAATQDGGRQLGYFRLPAHRATSDG